MKFKINLSHSPSYLKSDFEKIIEVTRMAKTAAAKQKEIGAPGQSLGKILLTGAQSLLRVDSDLCSIQKMFDNPNHQILAMRWYRTIEEMRTSCLR